MKTDHNHTGLHAQHQYQPTGTTMENWGSSNGGRYNPKTTCNNCGKQGHLFHQCKLPITSYGILLYRERDKREGGSSNDDDRFEFLMIRRKDSFGYIDFLRGKYAPHHIEKVQQIVDEMSLEERQNVVQCDFNTLWKRMWGENTTNMQYKMEEIASFKKFTALRSGINVNGAKVTLQQLVASASTSWTETEWEFPKGRRMQQEKDLECALREFEEETGISRADISVAENVLPFEEIFIGSNHKAYKHKYFLARARQWDVDVTRFQTAEVSAMEWKSFAQCMECIRPYHIEKKQLVQTIQHILTHHQMIETG